MTYQPTLMRRTISGYHKLHHSIVCKTVSRKLQSLEFLEKVVKYRCFGSFWKMQELWIICLSVLPNNQWAMSMTSYSNWKPTVRHLLKLQYQFRDMDFFNSLWFINHMSNPIRNNHFKEKRNELHHFWRIKVQMMVDSARTQVVS